MPGKESEGMDTIRAAVGYYPHTASLHGTATALGDQTELVVESLSSAGAFAQLLGELRYDVFEIPIVSFLVAQQQGIPVVAAPLFVTRRFHQSRLVLNRSTGVSDPGDLAGRNAGIRYHGFTDGTWARGILSHDFGLDPGQVTWVTAAPETVVGAPLPPNVRPSLGASLDDLLREGELSALILEAGRTVEGPGIEPIFADAAAAEEAWFHATGVVPINHLIAIQQRVLEEHPHLVEQLFDVFSKAKRQAIMNLPRSPEAGSEEANLVRLRTFLGDDPMPYGLDVNRAPLEMIFQLALDQQVITTPVDLATVFATPVV
jgi:4,5-dihydroxyphthalate decarboxylase